MTVETTFAVSGQHYLFNVQTFAHTVLALGGDAYAYALRDRTTQGVIDDVAGGKSDLGVLFQTSATADEVNAALDAAGLEFVELIQSAPRVALPKSHPMVNASSLSLEDMEDFPYLYFEQDEDSPVAFAEEALASVPRAKSIACTDRASLSELIVALNGYTVTSGILVGISDGAGLNTVPLDTDVKLHLGYVVRKGEALSRRCGPLWHPIFARSRKLAYHIRVACAIPRIWAARAALADSLRQPGRLFRASREPFCRCSPNAPFPTKQGIFCSLRLTRCGNEKVCSLQ